MNRPNICVFIDYALRTDLKKKNNFPNFLFLFMISLYLRTFDHHRTVTTSFV